MTTHRMTDSSLTGEKAQKVLSGIMGVVTADALGVPVEFQSREMLRKNPVTEMRGYGTYAQPKGTWSDDSTMTLCLLKSLTDCKTVDYEDIFHRFAAWADTGYMTPFGETFDMGHATMDAIVKFKGGMAPLKCGGTGIHSNGNGALMRILPMAFFTENMERKSRFCLVHNVASLTHGHLRSRLACGFYVEMAVSLLKGLTKEEAYEQAAAACRDYYSSADFLNERGSSDGEMDRHETAAAELKVYERVLDGGIASLKKEEIRSSGYVVDTLEAALWCLLGTESYAECVLRAVNLGEDTDTVAAVAGGLAGLVYGYEAIPASWRNVIVKRTQIEELCGQFAAVWAGGWRRQG